MRTHFAFHGGVHPPENKKQSTGLTVQIAPVPEFLIIPLSQHIGAPAEPVVSVGERVLKGQMIAEAMGRISVNVHASSSGVVEAIEPRPIPHTSGMEAPCIVIRTDGLDEWVDHQGLEDYRKVGKAALLEYIRDQGIAGMGGAGFPTDVKLHLGDDHIVNTLILNAMECEPYITADDMLLRERAAEIVSGIEVMAHLLKPHRIIIGTEDNKPQALRAIEKAVRDSKLDIAIYSVPTVYPSGGEKQLIKLMTGIEVPSGKIPADIGIVCQNVGTAKAIHDAVHHGIPLISRVVTLTGEALGHPHNLEARIGTPFATLLGAAELKQDQLYRLVMGGPMMGFTVPHDQIPVIKTTNCILAASYDEMPPAPPANPCIRCGMCEQVCPAELLPQQLHWFAKGKEFEKAKNHNLFDCIECGACSYVCPSNIPLVQYYRFAKAEIRAEEAEHRKADHARLRFEARQERLEREKAEKEARRKQRAEEAAKMQAVKQDKLERQAESASPDTAAAIDIKTLKTAAAVARTKLKKAQQALKNAQDKGLEGVDALRSTVSELEQKSAAAQAALDAVEQGVAATPVLDSKQLKTAAAVARTKLKQAEKALLTAQENGDADLTELQTRVAELTEKVTQTQAAYDAAESGAAAPSIDLDALQQAMNSAADKVAKARQALADAEANSSPAVEKMRAGVDKLEQKFQTAKAEYDQAAVATSANGADLAALKSDMEQAAAKVTKAETALQTARAADSPAVAKMEAGVDKLKGKYAEARQVWLAAGGVEEVQSEPDPKALKQQVSIMRTKLKKAQAAVDAAEAGEGDLDLASTELERLTALHAEAKSAWEAYESVQNEKAAAQGIDLKQLKIDAAMARAAVTKAERALDKARETSTEDLDNIEQELVAARQKADQLSQTLSRFTD
ncbi:electron transport complex subunit RsxC [Pontibacter sp. JAM-7]|uniref:electron transport complex subunit RsxC n=1 Tax=Pontibacter sp. JAM-7 TaxID=3366581 RepID=UPI003AF48055